MRKKLTCPPSMKKNVLNNKNTELYIQYLMSD